MGISGLDTTIEISRKLSVCGDYVCSCIYIYIYIYIYNHTTNSSHCSVFPYFSNITNR